MLEFLFFPFRLVFGLIGLIFNFVGGVIGAVFGLVGGLIGFLFSGAFIVLMLIGIVALVRYCVRRAG